MKSSIKRYFPKIMRCLSYGIIITITVLIITGIYECPLYYFFGIKCAGCGMTRAYKALLRFDLKTAFEYHSLFPIPALLVVYHIFRKKIGLNKRIENAILIMSGLMFFIRWIVIMI